jgi:hypothetical protein
MKAKHAQDAALDFMPACLRKRRNSWSEAGALDGSDPFRFEDARAR